ncbi:MAG: toll/interleukin-1 receptor domain-containing protein [Rhizobiales bacterium]|nr:toll/interleukin-1 receptor domain-containing protein [Hyphomicrobiales bacterium]
MVSTDANGPRLKVYVSYCGADAGFTDELIRGLQKDRRFDISVDPDCTIDEDDWKSLIGTLIADADAVIVVLSPDTSPSCDWEIECAQQHSKRIVPVLCRPLGATGLPAGLAGLKIQRFDDGAAFQRPLKGLMQALTSDAQWIREHTRLLAHARMWERSTRSNDLLLNGEEALAAKMWTLSRPDGAPKPTDLHIEFICISEAVATARASAAYAVQAERDELETLAHLNSENEGFRRWANQAYMVVGCWLAALALFSDWKSADAMKQVANARSYTVESCSPPDARRHLAVAIGGAGLKGAKCPSLRADRMTTGCLDGDELCSRVQN